MQTRTLGRTGRTVSAIGLGTWQLGADWGDVDESDALAVLDAAHESGVTFFDTADVYGDGRSESLIGRWLREHPGSGVTVATKMGRRMPQVHDNYSLANFRAWTDRSRANLGVDTLDLVQLHCPPSSVYADDRVFDALDTLVDEGAIANYGVSVETVEEALTAIVRPRVASVQIILNAFRLKPLDDVLPAARANGVGIIGNPPGGLRALPAMEVDFGKLPAGLAPILAYESKALPDSPYWTDIGFKRASLAVYVEEKLVASAKLLFQRYGLRDYGRFDFRTGADGIIKLMEVNPNPAWANDGKLAFMAGFAGMEYRDMLRLILETAIDRVLTPAAAGS